MKEKEVIKTFLEWTKNNSWINLCGNDWVKRKIKGYGESANTEHLFSLYEQETRMYTVREVWDEFCDEVSTFSQNLTAFAERYHELKKEGRIKP